MLGRGGKGDGVGAAPGRGGGRRVFLLAGGLLRGEGSARASPTVRALPGGPARGRGDGGGSKRTIPRGRGGDRGRTTTVRSGGAALGARPGRRRARTASRSARRTWRRTCSGRSCAVWVDERSARARVIRAREKRTPRISLSCRERERIVLGVPAGSEPGNKRRTTRTRIGRSTPKRPSKSPRWNDDARSRTAQGWQKKLGHGSRLCSRKSRVMMSRLK